MSYQFNVNNRVNGYGGNPVYFFYQTLMDLKTALVNAGWTITSSATFNSSLNINRLSLTGDILNNVADGDYSIANDISWFVAQDPAGIKQLLFLKNRTLTISGYSLLGGQQVSNSVVQSVSSTFISAPETSTQPNPNLPPVISPSPAFVYQCVNDFQFNGYICFNGFKWNTDSDVSIISNGQINGVNTTVYVTTPPSINGPYEYDICGNRYRVYDGVIINNGQNIGGGWTDNGTAGQLHAPGTANGNVIVNGKIVGPISGYHINSGFQVVNGVKTPVSNITIPTSNLCIDGSFVDNGDLNQTLTNANFVSSWLTFKDCFYSSFSVDYDHCAINLSPLQYTLTQPQLYGTVLVCGYSYQPQSISLADTCIFNIAYGLPIGTTTDISGTNNAGTYVPGYITQIHGYLMLNGYIITDGYVVRETHYLYDGYLDLTNRIYIADGYVGNGNIVYSTSPQMNSNVMVAYSANQKFNLGANGFYDKPISSVNPPIASDMVWLHKNDTYVGKGLRADGNGYYYPNNTAISPSITSPGMPDPYYDQLDVTTAQIVNFLSGIHQYDTWNYHIVCNNASPYNFYLLLTSHNQLRALFMMDTVFNSNLDNNDNAVFTFLIGNTSRYGFGHHSKYLKSWYGDPTTITSRSAFSTAISSNSARFFETSLLNLSFYQTLGYANINGYAPGTNISLATSSYTITDTTNASYTVTAVGGTNSVLLPTTPFFGQEITITNTLTSSFTVSSTQGIANTTTPSVSVSALKTFNFIYTGKVWTYDSFFSYLPWLNLTSSVPRGGSSIHAQYDLSASVNEYKVTKAGSGSIILPTSPYFGNICNINNAANSAVNIVGDIVYNGSSISTYPLAGLQNISLYFDGNHWINTGYDGIQLGPTLIDLSLGNSTLTTNVGKIAEQYGYIVSPSDSLPENQHYKVFLNRQPQPGDVVSITNATTSFQNIYGVQTIAGQSTGYPIGAANGISIAQGDCLVFKFDANNKSWITEKFTIAIPSNTDLGILSPAETLFPVAYAKFENTEISHTIESTSNSYRGMSVLFNQDSVKRNDLDMLDLNNTTFFITLNLNTDNKNNIGEDSGSTLTLPWENVIINPD